MTRYFLADIHLHPDHPATAAAFCRALVHIAAQNPDAVYLLGDLFDAWLGDDVELQNPFVRGIADAITALPCPVYLQHGNRDFLIGQTFARLANITLLAERHLFTANGKRILLEHGDLLCIHDHGYLRLRRILRNPHLQTLYALLPRGLKLRIAALVKKRSKNHKARKNAHTTDADRGESLRILEQYQADIHIHGHTHRPAVHRDGGKTRYVLGEWSENGGVILSHTDGTWQLRRFPQGEETHG